LAESDGGDFTLATKTDNLGSEYGTTDVVVRVKSPPLLSNQFWGNRLHVGCIGETDNDCPVISSMSFMEYVWLRLELPKIRVFNLKADMSVMRKWTDFVG